MITIDLTHEITREIDGKEQEVLQFYEKRREGTLVEYAYLQTDNDYITYKTEAGDINHFEKVAINDFIFNLYNKTANRMLPNNDLFKKSKSSKPFYEMKILGNTIPLAVFLLINKSTSLNAFEIMKLNYQFKNKKDNEAAINMPFMNNDQRYYLCLYPKTEEQTRYANGLNIYKLKNSNMEPTLESYILELTKLLLEKKGKRFANNLYTIEHRFIDRSTYKILQEQGMSTDLAHLFSNEMVKLLGQRGSKSQYDLDNYRLRMSETITSVAYTQMHIALSKFKARSVLSNEKLQVTNNYILDNLIDAGMLQYAKTLNPLEEMMLSLKVTKTGIGNSKKDQVTLNRRDLNSSYFGIMGPTATNEYGGIGVNQTLTNSAMIDDRFGNLSKKKFDNNSNPFGNLSPVESLSAFFEYDDTTRRIMGNQQTGQFTQLENPDVPLVQTGFEAYVPHLVSDRFIKKAKRKGTVKSISDSTITIEYDNGKIDDISIEHVKSRTKRGIYIATDYNLAVSKGEKVEEGTILAATDSLKTGKLAIGKNLVVAEMGYLGMNFEDGWVVSDKLTKKYSNKILQKITMVFDIDSVLKTMNIQKGHMTKAGDILMKFDTNNEFSDDDINPDDDEAESAMVGLYQDGLTKTYFSPGGKIKEIIVKLNTRKLPKDILTLYDTTTANMKRKVDKCKEETSDLSRDEKSATYADCIGHMENSEALEIGGHKFKQEEIEGAIIEVFIEKINPIINGSKFTLTSSGGKGTVQYIMKKGQEPIATETGLEIEFVGTPISIISRKNPSILLAMYLGKVIYFLNLAVSQLAKSNNIQGIKKLVLEIFGHIDQTENHEVLQQLHKFFEGDTKHIIKIINRSHPLNNPAFPAVVSPFKNKINIKNIEAAAKVIGVPLNEKILIKENNNIVTERAVPVGILPVNMLEHFPQAMSSTRGSLNVGKNWITGQGRNGTADGTGAIKIGLYDMNSLLSKRPYGLIKEMHSMKSDASKAKQKMLNSILKDNTIPDTLDIEVEQEDLRSLNLIKIYFKGAGLEANI